MDAVIVKEALNASLDFLNEEIQHVVLDELKEEYLSVIGKIENALKELHKNG